MRSIFLILILGTQSRAATHNYFEMIDQAKCAHQLQSKLNTKLQKQSWVPVTVSMKGQPLVQGIEFRNTREQKAYKIWSDSNVTTLVEENLNAKVRTIHTFDASNACEVKTTSAPLVFPPLPVDRGFADSDLHKTMKENEWGLIFIWTPYMPLSVQALNEIKKAAKAEKAHLTVLLDGKADIAEARKWIAKGLVKDTELLQVASNELYAREINLHFPIVLIYKDGFLSNRTYIGFKSSGVYQKWIQYELAELKKDLQ